MLTQDKGGAVNRAGTWMASAAVVTGLAGGSVLGLHASGVGASTSDSSAGPAQAAPDATTLQREVSGLLAEEHALRIAVAKARHRLGDQVHVSQASLDALRQRLATAQGQLARARAVQVSAGVPAPAPSVAPASRPPTHATTGASGSTTKSPGTHSTTGASGTGSGHDDGGHDDGGHDD